jgi:dTDP-4-dehydrorhamnose reductase
VRNIAIFSAKKQIRLIHISTDYVFDGRQKGDAAVYAEDDKTHPINIYGKSKLAGEKEIKKMLEGYFIIRTAWLYGSHGNNFISTMLRLFKEKEAIKVVDDQWGSPTYTVDLAGSILKIIEDDSIKYGIYHFTNEGVTNWYKFARAIYSKARKLNLISASKKVVLKAIKTEEYPTAAARPRSSILSKEKIKKEFNLEIRGWKEALTEYLSILTL